MSGVLIVGMQKSGQCRVVRALSALGARVVDAVESRAGRELRDVAHNVLSELRGGWDAPPDAGWDPADDALVLARKRLAGVVAKLDRGPTWVWSDPRATLLLPLWHHVAPALRVVVVARDPATVVTLLEKKRTCSRALTLRLWRDYYQRALAAPDARLVVVDERWADDPDHELGRLAQFVGITGDAKTWRRARKAVSGFQPFSHTGDEGLPDDVLDVWSTVNTAADAVIEDAPAPALATARTVDTDEIRSDLVAWMHAYGHALRAQIEQAVLARLAPVEPIAPLSVSPRAEVVDVTDAATEEDERASAYQALAARLRALLADTVPPGAGILMVSKGDDTLLPVGGRAWHFPSDDAGVWVGFTPASSTAALAQLAVARSRGATHLVIPATSRWWLDYYPDLVRYLRRYGAELVDAVDTATIFALDGGSTNDAADGVAEVAKEVGREVVVLDWTAERDLRSAVGIATVFQPVDDGDQLPHLDHSVDVVVIDAGSGRGSEAGRVASTAVIEQVPGGPPLVHAHASVQVARPSVSIVIPCYDGASITAACLDTVCRTIPRTTSIEIVVIDDASTDDTRQFLKGFRSADRRVRVLRNRVNRGFIRSCNRGAAAATGDVLVFLNNDTLPLHGWLEPLVDTLSTMPDAGAVGGRLVYADGSLQEAGAVVFCDGRGANVGRFELDPDAPPFTYLREVDYCSGALLATWRELFLSLGGFDVGYAPAYYEDSDYCFSVRAAGRRVYYQPESTIVHLEGASCGTDTADGVKRHQEINRARFVERWRRELVSRRTPPDRYDMATWLEVV